MSSRSFTHHADARFRIHIQHTHWGGRTYISATVYLQDWGLFYRATRTTANRAYHAADNAIRKFNAQNDASAYHKMYQHKIRGIRS
jgi:hypothetical protein